MTRIQAIGIGLIALTCAAMYPVLWCDFVSLDDVQYVTGNLPVIGGLDGQNLLWAVTDSCAHSGFFIPLIWLSFQLDATLFGPAGAWGFHLSNLLIHTASVLLCFLVLQRMTGSTWRSAVVAAVFAIHPLRVESVAWVTERKDVLSMFFGMLTLTAYAWYVESTNWRRWLVVLLVLVTGLMAKVTLITLPFALMLLDYWPLGRLRLGQTVPACQDNRPAVPLKHLILEKLPWLGAALIIAAVDLHLVRELGSVASAPLSYRVQSALANYLTALEKTFYPTHLAPLYPAKDPERWRVVLGGMVIVVVTLGAFFLRRRQPYLLIGWLWFLGTLFPVSGIVTIGPQSTADRFTYIPHVGLFVALVWGIAQLSAWNRIVPALRGAAVMGVLITLGVLTEKQTWLWRNNYSLGTHTLSVTRDNYIMHLCMGNDSLEQNDLVAAEYHCRSALALQPENLAIRNMYGYYLLASQQFAEAIPFMQETLDHFPADSEAKYILARAYTNSFEWDKARKFFESALEGWRDKSGIAPKARALQQLGMIHLRENASQTAIKHLTQAVEIMPNLPAAHRFLGIAYCREAHWSEAAAELRRAAALDASDLLAHSYLAYVAARSGNEADARGAYATLLRHFPEAPAQLSTNAIDLITRRPIRDIVMALEVATQACEATQYNEPRALDALAAAHAAHGAFARASELAARARSLTGDPDLIERLETRLKLYNHGQALPVDGE